MNRWIPEVHGFNRSHFNPSLVPSPAFVVDLLALEENLVRLSYLREATGAKVLLALKAFSMFSTFDLAGKYLDGVCASSPDEARLGREEFGKEVHSYCPAYTPESLKEFLSLSDHMVFNSQQQLKRLKPGLSDKQVSIGLRLNPEQPEAETPLYDPSSPFSRLGVPLSQFDGTDLKGVDGFHIHNLCEQNFDSLERTWEAIEKKFGRWIAGLRWLNLGGGHHITRKDYDVESLINLLHEIQKKYGVELYIEPGEAVALNTGVLVTTVIDIIHNGMDIAILDTSASCHMPDVLEMPYRPDVWMRKNPESFRTHTVLEDSPALPGM